MKILAQRREATGSGELRVFVGCQFVNSARKGMDLIIILAGKKGLFKRFSGQRSQMRSFDVGHDRMPISLVRFPSGKEAWR
jgi:hypothetical protein